MKCAWLHLLALLFVACGGSADENPLVDAVRVSNRAAIDSMRTVHFRYSVRKENIRGEVTVSPPSEYWRSGSTIRDVRRAADHETDTLVSNGRMISKSIRVDQETGKAEVTGSIGQFDGMPLSSSDPWLWSMMIFWGDENKPPVLICFDDLLKISHRIIRAERVVEQGRPLDLVEVEFVSGSRTTFWFDPAFNSLVCRMQAKTVDANSRVDMTVSEVGAFKDGGGGVYFPESVVRRRTINGKSVSTETIQFTEIEINKPMAADRLVLTYPAGTEVHDLVIGKRCTADADGKLVISNQELSFPSSSPEFPASQQAFQESILLLRDTRVEPPLNSRWLFYLAGFCSLAVLIAVHLRKRQTWSRLKERVIRPVM